MTAIKVELTHKQIEVLTKMRPDANGVIRTVSDKRVIPALIKLNYMYERTIRKADGTHYQDGTYRLTDKGREWQEKFVTEANVLKDAKAVKDAKDRATADAYIKAYNKGAGTSWTNTLFRSDNYVREYFTAYGFNISYEGAVSAIGTSELYIFGMKQAIALAEYIKANPIQF